MSVLNTPNVFVQGTTINAAPFNVNFAAIQTAVNNIDNSNIGAAGLFPSQLLPTTAGQATFGGMIGYNFLAPTASTTPLTVSGVAGQSADIFDVTLTSGGTKALSIYNSGAVGLNGAASGSIGDLGVARGAASGLMVFGSTSASIGTLDFGVSTASAFTFLSSNTGAVASLFAGAIQASASTVHTNAGNSAGDLVAQRSVNQGALFLGGSTAAGTIDFNINNAGAISFKTAAGAYAATFGALYTNLSDATLKMNVAPISGALSTLAKLKPSSYNWIRSDGSAGQADFGFVAQDVAAILPQITRTDNNGVMGIVYTGVTALNSAAIIELAALFKAYVTTHP